MRLVSLIVTMVVATVFTFYALTCSVNNAPPAPVHPIVGKWRMEIFCGQPSLEGSGINVCEFSADGSYVAINTYGVNNTERVIGNYEINQNVISMVCDPDQSHTAATRQKTSHIKFVESGNRLVITSDSNCDSETWVRVKK